MCVCCHCHLILIGVIIDPSQGEKVEVSDRQPCLAAIGRRSNRHRTLPGLQILAIYLEAR
jgi:hypothetical protein